MTSEIVARSYEEPRDPYGWRIDKDLLEGKEVEIIGPRDVSDALVARLRAGEGREFRMLDDDRIAYFQGRLIGGEGFEPLDDYGTPDSGAVHIQYRRGAAWIDL